MGGVRKLRALLEVLEAEVAEETEARVALALLAGAREALDEDLLRGALRRALLLLAAGGDPHRSLELDGRAVRALAEDLDAPAPRAELAAGLARLEREAEGLPRMAGAAAGLLGDPDLAWRCFAAALLAEELAG